MMVLTVVNVGWDLIQYYNTQVLNVPDSVFSGCGYVGNMILWDWKFAQLLEYFDEVDTHNMDQGDVCIWYDTMDETHCHVAVFDGWDGYDCWYFSQNPNPCRVMTVEGLGNPRAFRRKKETPPAPPEPTPVITPNVPEDKTRNQIKVLIDTLYVRTTPGGQDIGFANPGYYNYLETQEEEFNGVKYLWYRIADSNWIASKEGEWTEVHPKEEETKEQIQKEYAERILKNMPTWLESIIEK